MTVRKAWSVASLLVLIAALPLSGEAPPVWVPPFGAFELSGPAELKQVLAPPAHGQLQPREGGLSYQPADSFWALGLDSLVYEGADGRATTLVLVAGRNVVKRRTGFEPTDEDPWLTHDEDGRLAFGPAAALSDELGLRISPGASPAFVEPQPSHEGSGSQGTGSGMKIRLPGPPNGGGPWGGFITFHELLYGTTSVVRLRLLPQGTDTYDLRVRVCGGSEERHVELPAGTHRLALDARQGSGAAEARLRVNDIVVVHVKGSAHECVEGSAHHAFGALDTSTTPWALDLDELAVGADEVEGASQLVFSSDFERDAEPWRSTGLAGLGEPSLSEDGALNGKLGALLQLGTLGYWHTTAPDAEPMVGLRLGLGVGAGVQLPAGGLTIVGGSSSDAQDGLIDVFGLRLVSAEGRVQLEGRTWAADGTPLTRSVAIQDGQPHLVELQWYAAGPAHDGLLRLWLDGVVAGEITQIDGAPLRLESLTLGVRGPGPGHGRVAVDDVLVWRPVRTQ